MSLASCLMALLHRNLAWAQDAEARGARLLAENLSPSQLEQLGSCGGFEVRGGQTARRYRIRRSSSLNIDELDDAGNRVVSWCFLPKGDLSMGDIMLAQKVALELFEQDALAVAYRYARDRRGDTDRRQHSWRRPVRVTRLERSSGAVYHAYRRSVGAGIFSLPRTFGSATGPFGAIIAAGGMYVLARVFQTLAEQKPNLDAGGGGN